MPMALLHLACLAVCLLAAAVTAWTPGVATFTGSDTAESVPNGACGYGVQPRSNFPSMKLAGISFAKNPLSKNPSKGCGSCLEVRCTDQFCSSTAPLTVLVYDDCDECDANQVNLQALPFATFARPELGRINVEWRQVPCAYDGNIVVGVDKFRASDGGWVRLVFKRVNGGSVEKAEIAKAGSGSFVAMKNSFGAVWEASNLPELPWDIRLTVADGKSIVLRNALTSPNTGDAETKGNF